MDQARAAFGAELQSVSQARRFVRDTLEVWGLARIASEASLCVTELTTNSVIHARTRFDVVLRLDDDLLRLAVRDGSSRFPTNKVRTVQATTGRGLPLVEGLSDSWGVEAEVNGKTVWCEWAIGRAGNVQPEHTLYSAESSAGWVNAESPDSPPDDVCLADESLQDLSERAA